MIMDELLRTPCSGSPTSQKAARAQKGVHREMRRSAEVRDALLRFYEVFPAGELEEFAQIIVRENEGVLVIGTDPAQWTEGREQWIEAREAVVHAMEGLCFEADEQPHGYEEGSIGSRGAARASFREGRTGEVRRISLPRTPVNRGKGLYKK
jgi:hypothetical protein